MTEGIIRCEEIQTEPGPVELDGYEWPRKESEKIGKEGSPALGLSEVSVVDHHARESGSGYRALALEAKVLPPVVTKDDSCLWACSLTVFFQ